MYVGKSTRGMDRPKEHGSPRNIQRYGYLPICRWITKGRSVGSEYKITVLETCSTAEELNEAERFYIAYFRSIGVPLLNLSEGGDGGHAVGWKPSEAKRLKTAASLREYARTPAGREQYAMMSERRHTPEVEARAGASNSVSQRGRKHSDETKEKLRVANVGKKMSGETREKIAEAHRGAVISTEHRARISAANTGKKHSPEARVKMSLARRGKVQSPETIARQVAANRGRQIGRKFSPETRAKMSLARRGVVQSPEVVERRAASNRGKHRTAEQRARIGAAIHEAYRAKLEVEEGLSP